MKVNLAVIALALLPVSAYAQSNEFEGFNVGLGVGYVQPKVTYTDNNAGYYRWNEEDFVPQVEAAYGMALNDRWLVGIGFAIDLGKTNAGTKSEAYGPVETTMKDHYSIYVQPTYAIDGASAVFARIGYHAIKVDAIGQPGAAWLDDKFRTRGIGYGLGYKRFISNGFFLQAEVQFVNYESRSFNDGLGYVWDYEQKTTAAIFTAGYKF